MLESELQLETKQQCRNTIGEPLSENIMQLARELALAQCDMLKPYVPVLERLNEFHEALTPQALACARGRTAVSSIEVMMELYRVSNRLRSWGMIGEKKRRHKPACSCLT
jgi:hypothetical protein